MTLEPGTRLLLAPAADVVRLDGWFRFAGWVRSGELPETSLQGHNDQLLALWQGPEGATAELVTDGFIHWLEFRDTEKTDREAAARALPHLDAEAIAALLTSSDLRQVVAGIHAAQLLADTALAPFLAALHSHPDELVRAEASEALQAMLPDLIGQGTQFLREKARREHGANPAWDLLEPAWFRRQTLRWLLHDYPKPTPGVEATLRAALADPDWEVRAGALIGAVRYRLRSLGGLVETCPLPRVSRNGPDAPDRALLRALRQVGTALLAGRVPPVLGADASPKAQALDRLARLLTPPPLPPHDPAALLVHALTTPVQGNGAEVPLPPGITEDDEGFQLDGVRLVKVPWVNGWLGDEKHQPIRGALGGGFFLAEEPVAKHGTALTLEGTEALAWCKRHPNFRLPTVEEWELAVRGNDGRRFPWGNGFQDDSLITPGPWGTWGHGSMPEWALAEDGSPVRCGPYVSLRQTGEGKAGLRPVAKQKSEM